MRYSRTLTIALWLWCPWSLAAPTTELEPRAVTLGDSGQSGLSVLKVVLPGAPFAQRAQVSFVPAQWRIVDRDNALRQLYSTAAEDGTAVHVYGLLDKPQGGRLEFYFARDGMHFGEPVFSLPLHLEQRPAGADTALAAEWSAARNRSLAQYVGEDLRNELPALWMRIADRVYGGGVTALPQNDPAAAAEPRWPTLFSLFSGEAAIQETLQQQVLSGAAEAPVAGDLGGLRGPAIASHPFQALLQGQAGGSLPIADLVPAERYFVHFNDPGMALSALDKLAEISHTLIGLRQQSYLRRDLLDRYLQRLGLNRERVQQLSPLARQAALFGPDPFFEEGTHLTLLVEAALSPVLERWLGPLLGGAAGGGEDAVQPFAHDSSAYFARHERWLIFSTSAAEATAALQLARTGGQGSLGRSAEFRYMLSLLPQPEDKPGLYLYLSDPLIRALIGPRLKIAQLRRQQARARLHLVTAAALLYQLDHGRTAALDELLQRGYVERGWLQSWEGDRITLSEEGIAESSLYGTLARMIPLADLPIGPVSAAERTGYQQYVDDYSRFWSTYFDPIGIRIAFGEPLRIETLILPLVRNSVYQALRQAIGGDTVDLTLPGVLPTPVTTVGVKLPQALVRDWVAGSGQQTGVRSWLEQLGDSLHIALYDSDPLLALGSADLSGAFSGPWLGGGGDLLLWGLLGSWLTQPTAVFVKLKSAEGALDDLLLEDVLGDLSKHLDFGDSTLEQLGENGSRGWVYTLNVEGLIRFHLYIRKIYQYLVISNRQINFRADTKPALEAPPANAALTVAFDQIQALAPTLHLHRMQRQRQAVMNNIGRLLPFMLLGAGTAAEAIERQARLYGSRAEHPPGGEWLWQPQTRRLASAVFGSPGQPRVPSYYDPDEERGPGGVMDSLKSLEVSLRFAEDGARIILSLTNRRSGGP
jgi:hypothetical protein